MASTPIDDLDVTVSHGAVSFALRVRPGGRKNRVLGCHDGALRLEVTAAPERGKANEAVIRLLAGLLDVPRPTVDLLRGAGSRRKVVRVDELGEATLRRRLEAALDETGGRS